MRTTPARGPGGMSDVCAPAGARLCRHVMRAHRRPYPARASKAPPRRLERPGA